MGRSSAWLIALAALFSATVLVSTIGDELGVSSDSTQYLSAAQNVASGNGLKALSWSGREERLTHFPPLYPVLVAQLTRGSGNVSQAAYLLNVFLAPINVLLLALLAARTTRGLGRDLSLLAAALAAVCGSVANHLLLVHAMAWSEPLFICLLLLSLIALLNVLENPRGLPWYLVLVFSAAAAVMARFAGVALIGTIALAIVLLQRTSLRQRLRRAMIVTVTSVVPEALLLMNNANEGTTANREIAVHLIRGRDVAYGLTTALDWAVPSMPYPMGHAAFIGMYVVAFAFLLVPLVSRARPSLPTPTGFTSSNSTVLLTTALGVFIVTYIGFLFLSISIADRSTMLDKRILSPALAVLLVVAVSLGVHRLGVIAGLPAAHRMFSRSALAMLLAVYVLAQSLGLLLWFTRVRARGIGFAQVERTAPALVERMRRLPPSAVLYSNSPYLVHFLTGRTVIGIPFRFSPTSLRANAALPKDLTAMRDAASGNAIYLIDVGQRQSYLVRDSIIAQFVHVDSVQSLPGGRIQFIEPPD